MPSSPLDTLLAGPPPPRGRAARALWALEEDAIFLNHGSFGATPRGVLEAQAQVRARMEAQPVRYFVREEPGLVRAGAAALAGLLGTAPERLVLVENATTGVNTVLRSAPLPPGAVILGLSHIYPAVRLTLERLCAERGWTLRLVPLPCPVASADAVVDAVERSLDGVALAVLDHIPSFSGLVLPIARMVAACRARGVPVLVDGAHGPGHVPLNLDALGADWYVGNAHKWLCAPKGCALLAVGEHPPFEVHPLVCSHGTGGGLAAEFDFTGTQDRSAWCVLPELLRFWRWLGLDGVREGNRAQALRARAWLIAALGTEGSGPEELVGCMAAVRLPARFGPPTPAAALASRSFPPRD